MLMNYPVDRALVVTAEARLPPLDADLEHRVEEMWRQEQTKRGTSLFNGAILSVVSHSPERIEVGITEYRRFLAQRRDPTLFGKLGVRPLAVSGLMRCRDGVVLGRRSNASTQDAGRWELVPSGGVDARAVGADGAVSLIGQLMVELREETGCPAAAVTSAEPFLLVEDSGSQVIDIGIDLVLDLDAASVLAAHRSGATDEYALLRIVPDSELTTFVSQARPPVVEVSRALLEARGLLARAAAVETPSGRAL